MTDAGRPPRWDARRSVFAKLVVVMLVMAFLLIGMVTGFFIHFVNPVVGASVRRTLGDYTRRLAAEQPGPEQARRLAARMAVQIRYEGPGGTWATDATLPSIAVVQEGQGFFDAPLAGSRYVVAAPDGGQYLFAWDFGHRTKVAHDRMLMMLTVGMLAVFWTAHRVMTRALRPLRALQDGVQRLSAGDLDVVLENRTRDEFGALTGAFNTMAARVKEMVKARDQLLTDVSHELRSPLTRLKVALALLPDSAKKAQAESDTAEMEAMITELLEFERLRDPRALRTEPTDLVALARAAAAPFAEGPPGVRVVAPPGAITLDVDADGLRTVLRNLLGNAVKYALPDSREIELSVRRDGGAVVLSVTDDGPGIPEDDLPRLFEPFFRVDRSRSRRTGGYGLGLSICKRVVEAHGGRIEAANNPGRGARVTVTLPVR